MSKETRLSYVLGTDHQFVCEVLDDAETAAVNCSAFAMSFMLKRELGDADADALLTKTTSSGIAVSGSFNADPAVNTQVATVTIADTDTDAIAPGLCRWELKRTDAGYETQLGYGTIQLVRGVHRT